MDSAGVDKKRIDPAETIYFTDFVLLFLKEEWESEWTLIFLPNHSITG
jgi:hypothetical protein